MLQLKAGKNDSFGDQIYVVNIDKDYKEQLHSVYKYAKGDSYMEHIYVILLQH